jgi:hypothetical protein
MLSKFWRQFIRNFGANSFEILAPIHSKFWRQFIRNFGASSFEILAPVHSKFWRQFIRNFGANSSTLGELTKGEVFSACFCAKSCGFISRQKNKLICFLLLWRRRPRQARRESACITLNPRVGGKKGSVKKERVGKRLRKKLLEEAALQPNEKSREKTGKAAAPLSERDQ